MGQAAPGPVAPGRSSPSTRTLLCLAAVLGAAACVACSGPRGVAFALVGHEYLLAGTVVDARSGQPLADATLTLKVRSIGSQAQPMPLRRGVPMLATRRQPQTYEAQADGTFEIDHVVRRADTRRRILGLRFGAADRPPAVSFLLAVTCPGYLPATREILPPDARDDEGRFAMAGLRIALVPEKPPSPR